MTPTLAGHLLTKSVAAVIVVVGVGVLTCGPAFFNDGPSPAPSHDRDTAFRESMLAAANLTVKEIPIWAAKYGPFSNYDAGASDSFMKVEGKSEIRLYPLKVLEQSTRCHVLNDTLDGVPIAVTWCDLAKRGAVYSRALPGHQEPVELATAGFSEGQLQLYAQHLPGRWGQYTGTSDVSRIPQLAPFPSEIVTAKQWQATGGCGTVYVVASD